VAGVLTASTIAAAVCLVVALEGWCCNVDRIVGASLAQGSATANAGD